MGRIYRNAQRVLVWLGVHSSDSEQAIHFVKMFLIVLDSRNPGRFLDMCMMVAEYKNLRSGMPSRLLGENMGYTGVSACQECPCSLWDRTFDWTAGRTFFDFLQGDRDRYLETDPESVAIIQTPAIQLLETALVLQKRNTTLKRLLYRHENSLCRESRDKVYGLLALASDCQDRTLQPDYDKDISRIWRDTLGLEMTGHFYGQQISADLVRYSHFLQRFLKIWHSGPESLLTSIPRDPFCILGCSIGRLQAIDVEHQTIMHHSFRTTQMFDSEFLIQKGLKPPQTNLFGDLLDPTKAPKGYVWLDST